MATHLVGILRKGIIERGGILVMILKKISRGAQTGTMQRGDRRPSMQKKKGGQEERGSGSHTLT